MKYKNISEQDLVIELSDGKKIHGLLRGEISGKNVVVLMHGLTSSPKETIIFLGSRYLYEKGYTTLSLYMYDFPDNYRNIFDCDLDVHVNDFETVINFIKNHKPKKLFSVGHSYGGLTILKANSLLHGAALWDPSHGLSYQSSNSFRQKYDERVIDNYSISEAGTGWMYPKKIGEYNINLGDNSNWAKNLPYPVRIISAGNGILNEYHKKYLKYLSDPSDNVVINDATHGFDDSDEVMENLFLATENWFHKFL